MNIFANMQNRITSDFWPFNALKIASYPVFPEAYGFFLEIIFLNMNTFNDNMFYYL